MQIELLYFDSCLSWQTACDNLRAVLGEMSWPDEVHLIRVETEEEAVETRFGGSPTSG